MADPEVDECLDWLTELLRAGALAYIPEIIDYELRRELIRTHLKGGTLAGLTELDTLTTELHYLPLTTPVMRRAAAARNQGKPPARDEALDSLPTQIDVARPAIDVCEAQA